MCLAVTYSSVELSVCLSVAPLPEVWPCAMPHLLLLHLHLPPHGLRGPGTHVPGVQRFHHHRRVSRPSGYLTPECKLTLPLPSPPLPSPPLPQSQSLSHLHLTAPRCASHDSQ